MANKLYILGTLVVAGTALAACGSSAQTGAATTTTAPTKTSKVAHKPKTVAKPVVSAPVGFNATDTVFVLPNNLGDLPAPELAIAKSDPAYAAGLADYENWKHFSNGVGWIYVGQPSTSMGAINAKVALLNYLYLPGTYWATPNPSIRIVASQLNYVNVAGPSAPYLQVGQSLVGPTQLEVRAAPLGTFVVNGVTHAAICVPEPIAVVEGGQVITPPAGLNFTAGPNTVAVGYDNTNANGVLTAGVWDQGVDSCAGFN